MTHVAIPDPNVTAPAPGRAPSDPAAAQRFAQDHFGAVDLGHVKRNAALVRAAECICRHPGGTLPEKFGSPADYKSMDRLMNRPEVSHESVLRPHVERTRRGVAVAEGVVLLLHDTTELDYSGLSTIPSLGPIGNGGCRGYLCHNTLAVLPNGREVLGLVNQILHVREPTPPRETAKAKRERASRESRLWTQAVAALGPADGEALQVDVADRGADIFEFLAAEEKLGRACLVRATHNRCILVGHDPSEQASGKLFEHLRKLPAAGGSLTKEVTDEKTGERRSATLAISYGPVRLCPPRGKRGEYEERPLMVWAARVWELGAPSGSKPVEWFLLHNREVGDADQAWVAFDWYACRPMMEEYHKGMKTGCQIEDLQFESASALEPMIALLSVVAVMLLQLREALRRPGAAERAATELVDEIYEEVTRQVRYPRRRER